MPIIIGTREDGAEQTLPRALAVASSSPELREELLQRIDGVDVQLTILSRETSTADELVGALESLHSKLIDRILQIRRSGGEDPAKPWDRIVLAVDGITGLLHLPEEGEHEWFTTQQKHRWIMESITKLMSANPRAGTHIVLLDSFEKFAKLSESSHGYEMLMKTDALMLGASTPEQRAGLLRIEDGDDGLGVLDESSIVYADAEWFHRLTAWAGEPAGGFASALAIYDALAPALGISEATDERLVALSNTVAELASAAGLEVPSRIKDAYRVEIPAAA